MINNNRLQVQRLNPEPVNIVTIQPPIHTNERRQVKTQSGTLIMKDRLFPRPRQSHEKFDAAAF